MPRYIEFCAEDAKVTAVAELLDDKAPKTCELVWNMLPISGYFHHAIYSGPELAMVLPDYFEYEPEHATSTFFRGKSASSHYAARITLTSTRTSAKSCSSMTVGADPAWWMALSRPTCLPASCLARTRSTPCATGCVEKGRSASPSGN